MNASRKNAFPSWTLLALAVAAAWSTVQAQDISEVAAPGGSSVAVGVGIASGDEHDRARFGMFNGLRKHDVNGLIGFRYEQPWSASGTGLRLEGRNLGLDNRELNFVYRRPGDFKATADYSEITRHDPRTINTSMQGAGTTTPVVNPGGVLIAPGTGQNIDLELKRKAISLGGEKWINRNLQVELAFKNEDKDGARLFGKGFACSATWQTGGACTGTTAAGILLLPEPIDSTIRQVDARLNYTNGPLVLSGGYYGSFYINHLGSLRPTVNAPLGNQNNTGTVSDALLLNTLALPLALPPDSQAHTLSLAGNYALTHSTRVNFKYAYTRATQDESFTGMGLTGAPGGRDNLGGEINTTKAQLGISSHVLPKLHVTGDLAYLHKQNKTPLDYYNMEPVTGGTGRFTNGNQSPTTIEAKVQGSYNFLPGYTGVLGLKVEEEDFGKWTPTDIPGGITGVRQKMETKGWRAELRRAMSERFTGSVAYENERKKGDSPWLKPQSLPVFGTPLVGVFEASPDCVSVGQNACIYNRTGIIPFMYMDRERDKIRLMGNWTATEKIGLQLFYDRGIDRFHGPTEHGLRTSQMGNVALDASYAMSDDWKFSAYAQRGSQTVASGQGANGYDLTLHDVSWSFGLGAKGKVMARLQVGADLMWLNDVLEYKVEPDAVPSAAATTLATTGGLPDITYRVTRLNLYGEYALQKNAYVRLDYIYYRNFFNDWMFINNGVPYLYSDNTTVTAQERQTVNFIGATYVYKFQ